MSAKCGLAISKKNILMFLLTVPVLALGLWRVRELHQPIVLSDEYGYWSNSAFFIGRDWSQITSGIGYYSYGYSLILLIVQGLRLLFGLGARQIYQAALVLNAVMLVAGYLLANKICERFFRELAWPLSNIVCLVIFIYTSNVFYSHLVMTETTILFCFWLFLYLMMKAVDHPGVVNHALFGLISVYMFAVHQRTIAVAITSVIVVIMVKAAGLSHMKDCIAYFASLACSLQIHSVIKLKLQNDSYMGLEPVSWKDAAAGAVSWKSAVAIAGIVLVLAALFLIENGRAAVVCRVALAVIAAAVIYVAAAGLPLGMGTPQTEGYDKIAVNDFQGQWGKIRNVFTPEGAARLGISITGKWFYMASATGLVVCWGIWDLLWHGMKMTAAGVKPFVRLVFGKNKKNQKSLMEKAENAEKIISSHIWYFGVFLVSAGTFMVSALYKEGFYKNDDLVNGRYNEFLMGILLLCSLEALLRDKRWILRALVFGTLYIIAGNFCEYVFRELGRTEFELCHSVIFGRVIWNYQVPVGRIAVIFRYVIPLSAAFILIVKAGRPKMSFLQEKSAEFYAGITKISTKLDKIKFRYIIALVIPTVAWTHLSFSLLEHYTVSVSGKYDRILEGPDFWIQYLDSGEEYPVYFIEDTKDTWFAQMEQYLMQDRSVGLITSADGRMAEDAFFIAGSGFVPDETVWGQYYVICDTGSVQLMVAKDSVPGSRWAKYKGLET